MKTAYELAKENYPINWNKAMIKKLVKLKKITKDEYKDITGEDYTA